MRSGREAYSFKNFIMRIVIRTVVTIAWLGLLGYLGDRYHRPGHSDWELFVWITGAAVVLFWLVLGWQVLRARFGHFYEALPAFQGVTNWNSPQLLSQQALIRGCWSRGSPATNVCHTRV